MAEVRGKTLEGEMNNRIKDPGKWRNPGWILKRLSRR